MRHPAAPTPDTGNEDPPAPARFPHPTPVTRPETHRHPTQRALRAGDIHLATRRRVRIDRQRARPYDGHGHTPASDPFPRTATNSREKGSLAFTDRPILPPGPPPRRAASPNSAAEHHRPKLKQSGRQHQVDTVDAAADPDATGCHWLLIRRNRRTGELAYYRAYAPGPVPLTALVRVAGTRWRIEESFQSGKELTALDQHQVRRWTSWHRWTVLAMLAHAFLSVMTATQPADDPHTGLIPLTRNEIRRLFTAATATIQQATHTLHWSTWRRRHQARSRTSHYQRQAAALT